MTDLSIGDVLSNEQLSSQFKCSNQGGMRRSLKSHALVLISDHTKSTYEDRWDGPVMHYTGMGLTGDQQLDFGQNKTLFNSKALGVNVHLFEVFKPREYCYQGQVQLASDIYREIQPDKDGHDREVIIFPLVRTDGSTPSFSPTQLEDLQKVRQRNATKLPDHELARRARTSRKKIGSRTVTSVQHFRDAYVSEYAKRRANGVCQLCEQPAPFKNRKGEPYLETHHIIWMSRDGDDVPENTVALCPNCHRRMHVVDDQNDVAKLQKLSAES